jgi:hypothetical protein
MLGFRRLRSVVHKEKKVLRVIICNLNGNWVIQSLKLESHTWLQIVVWDTVVILMPQNEGDSRRGL